MDNLRTGSVDNIAHLAGRERFRFVKHDVTDYIFLEGPVDAVIHLASLPSPVDYLNMPIYVLDIYDEGELVTDGLLGSNLYHYEQGFSTVFFDMDLGLMGLNSPLFTDAPTLPGSAAMAEDETPQTHGRDIVPAPGPSCDARNYPVVGRGRGACVRPETVGPNASRSVRIVRSFRSFDTLTDALLQIGRKRIDEIRRQIAPDIAQQLAQLALADEPVLSVLDPLLGGSIVVAARPRVALLARRIIDVDVPLVIGGVLRR